MADDNESDFGWTDAEVSFGWRDMKSPDSVPDAAKDHQTYRTCLETAEGVLSMSTAVRFESNQGYTYAVRLDEDDGQISLTHSEIFSGEVHKSEIFIRPEELGHFITMLEQYRKLNGIKAV